MRAGWLSAIPVDRGDIRGRVAAEEHYRCRVCQEGDFGGVQGRASRHLDGPRRARSVPLTGRRRGQVFLRQMASH
jgi:hypothetical protein